MDRYTGPIVAGMKVWTNALREKSWTVASYDPSQQFAVKYEGGGGGDSEDFFRAYRIPVDAPAEKRVLAANWIESASMFKCDACRAVTAFCQEVAPYKRACEACAPSMGAFAPPAPAKPACKACGFDWCGDVMDQMPWDGRETFSLVGLGERGPRYGSRECSARDADRAKPAEPKPAPTMASDCVCPCAPCFCRASEKPAPTEKAKREWVRQLEGATLTADSPYAKWAALQTGVASGLEREKRAINVRGVRSIYLPPMESQGERLSRLVESGLRADVRQDETRFEAAVRRGAK